MAAHFQKFRRQPFPSSRLDQPSGATPSQCCSPQWYALSRSITRKISVAITKAFVAVEGSGADSIAAYPRGWSRRLPLQIVATLLRRHAQWSAGLTSKISRTRWSSR